jgi:hypothetical protein
MLKVLNCVNCEPINKFNRIYPCETSVEFLFNFYLGVSINKMYSRYSDVSLKNDKWRKIRIRDIEGILKVLKR